MPEYVQTSALWTRRILENEFAVAPKDMIFFMERMPKRSHAGAIGFTPPPGVTVNQIPPEKSSIASMMLTGELDASMSYNRKQEDLIDRSDAARQASRQAFNRANDIADAERREQVAYHIEMGLVPNDYSKRETDHHTRA